MPGGIHPPLAVIESWPTPNYVDPHTRGWSLVILMCVLYAIALLAVVARLWARLGILHNAGADDAIIVAAMVPATAMTITIGLASRKYGFDRHVWDVPLPVLKQNRKATFAIECFYVLGTTLTRISILFFYRRMAAGSVSKSFLWAVRASIVFVIAYGITFEVTLFASCTPFHAFWQEIDPTWAATHKHRCTDEGANLYAASVVSVVQDLITCLLPTMLFWKLQLPRRQKIALGAIFGVGFFLCIAGILRIYYIHFTFYETYDVTWAGQDNWIWTGVEALLGIVCASAPALKVFVRRYTNFSGFGSGVDENG
ncbi:hypothetical protein NA57DRAFT_35108, partial [Rhizodiscina lignyota]